MKRYLLISLIALFAMSSSQAFAQKSGKKQIAFVSTFLTYMDHEKGPKYTEMMGCISPEYIKKNNIDVNETKVNNYSVWGYKIMSFDAKTNIVVARIWGENKKWMHELTFKILKEGKKMYFDPSEYSDGYIDPWYTVKTYIKD